MPAYVHIVRSTGTQRAASLAVSGGWIHTPPGAGVAALGELAARVDSRLAVSFPVTLRLLLVRLVVEDVAGDTLAGAILNLEGALFADAGAQSASCRL